MSDRAKLILTVLMALWVMVFCYAFYGAATAGPTGDGFTRGLNRVSAYLGWQGVAGMIALAVLGVGRGWPEGSPVRRLTWVPLLLALAHVAAIAAVVLWATLAG